jgi:predicted HTH domain antitoxin
LRPVVRGASADERAVLDALRDLRWIPDTTPEHVITRIADLFRSKQVSFERVARFARKEPPRVRALLGAIGRSIGADPHLLDELKRSLNPMTHFSLGLSDRLETAREWNIR